VFFYSTDRKGSFRADKNDKSGTSKESTFGADRALEESAGAQGEDRKRAVDANRTGGGERSETAPKPDSRKGSGKDDPRI